MKTLEDYKKDIKEKQLSFFKENIFSPEEEVKYLEESLRQNNLPIIKHYVEKGIRCDMTSTLVFDSLTKRVKGLETLKYLETQGINALDIVKGKLVALSAENLNIGMLKFFLNKLEDDDFKIMMSLIRTPQFHKLGYKFIPIDQLEEKIQKISPVIALLLPKLSQENLDFALKTMLNEELKDYIRHQYFELKIPEKEVDFRVKRKKL